MKKTDILATVLTCSVALAHLVMAFFVGPLEGGVLWMLGGLWLAGAILMAYWSKKDE